MLAMVKSRIPDSGRGEVTVPHTVRVGDDLVRFRDYQPGDGARVAAVLAASFGGFYAADKPVDESDYIAWFAEPHTSHLARVMIGEVGTRIVVVAAGLYRDIKVGDRVLYGVAGGIGNATHPDFQRRGLYRARSAWSAATDPERTANVATHRPGYVSARPEVPFGSSMGVYLYVQRPWLAARARKAGRATLNALPITAMALWSRLRPRLGASREGDVTLRTLPTFDRQFEPFLERASASWDVIPVRSVEYMNWRFCDPRAGEFTVRAAYESGELAGYSVTHSVGSRGYILDLLALPGRLDVVRTLVDDALRRLGEAGTAAVECWMLCEQPYARVLRQAGFIRLPGRSAEITGEIGWYGTGFEREERALLASPDTQVHLVRADFDGI